MLLQKQSSESVRQKHMFLIISQENTCVGASFLISCRLITWNFIKKRLQYRSFPMYISKHILMWIGWYFVVAGWYFWCCCCWWCCHIKLLIKSSLTPLVRLKAVFMMSAAVFRMFVYVLLKFDWLMIFFLENSPRNLKILNFFSLIFFSRCFKCHDYACSGLKSGEVFCQRRNFNGMKNELRTMEIKRLRVLAIEIFQIINNLNSSYMKDIFIQKSCAEIHLHDIIVSYRKAARYGDRSSHQRCSVRKGVLISFAKFTGKHLCQSLSFDKVAGTGVFLWILESFKNTFFTEHSWATAPDGDKSLNVFGPKLWNQLPPNIKAETCFQNFKEYINKLFGLGCKGNVYKMT